MLYPIKFNPIYKSRIWGGNMMNSSLNRTVPNELEPVGEAWELVDREEDTSVIANGEFAGTTLSELLKKHKADILGPKGKDYEKFPLLIKIIDAGERLSLQVHPDAAVCKELNDNSEPKTELWYILDCEKTGEILAGLDSRATKIQIFDNLHSVDIKKSLQCYDSKVGDAYFITSGTLHAIGGGNLILEIQQNSDTTFRVSDWGRVDKDGNSRELHIEKGIKSINFTNRISPKITSTADNTNYNRRIRLVQHCPFFAISELRLVDIWKDNTFNDNSFHLLSAVNKPFSICQNGEKTLVNVGETILLPYAFGEYSIEDGSLENELKIIKTNL